jgi:hypothetical protein
MTTKTLVAKYAAGYAVKNSVTVLSIATTGYVENQTVASYPALGAAGSCAVINDGKVKAEANSGIYLQAGGSVTNGTGSDTSAPITGPVPRTAAKTFSWGGDV